MIWSVNQWIMFKFCDTKCYLYSLTLSVIEPKKKRIKKKKKSLFVNHLISCRLERVFPRRFEIWSFRIRHSILEHPPFLSAPLSHLFETRKVKAKAHEQDIYIYISNPLRKCIKKRTKFQSYSFPFWFSIQLQVLEHIEREFVLFYFRTEGIKDVRRLL